MKMLEVNQLSIKFGGLVAVDHIDMTMAAGETVGIIGPNGSGKTTFFNLLSGIYRPTSGTITLNGIPCQGLSPDKIFRLGMARTFQNGRLFWNLNVLENVMIGLPAVRRLSLGRVLFDRRGEKIRQQAAMEEAVAVLNIFGDLLLGQVNKLAKDLPYADRRRLEICRALASNPQVILLDEPSAGMDAVETEKLMFDLQKVKEQRPDLSIIVVEHDMDFISGLVDRVMVFNYGKCLAQGRYDEVSRSPEVIKAYLGEEGQPC